MGNHLEDAIRKNYEEKLAEELRPGVNAGGPGQSTVPLGVGNLSGWATAAGMIGAVLGGILGRGLTGATVGALLFSGGLALLVLIARRTKATDIDAPVWPWFLRGTLFGGIVGAVVSLGGNGSMMATALNWGAFFGLMLGLYRWVARGVARRDYPGTR